MNQFYVATQAVCHRSHDIGLIMSRHVTGTQTRSPCQVARDSFFVMLTSVQAKTDCQASSTWNATIYCNWTVYILLHRQVEESFIIRFIKFGTPNTFTKQYNLVPANGRWCLAAGKVTVDLASHWPCVTDNSGITTYGLMALEREMSTPPIPSRSMAHFTLIPSGCLTWLWFWVE